MEDQAVRPFSSVKVSLYSELYVLGRACSPKQGKHKRPKAFSFLIPNPSFSNSLFSESWL